MSTIQTCPDCGAAIPADAPQGQCPKCLLRAGFESGPGTAATQPAPAHSTFVPPSVAELQSRFPQYELLELLGKGGMGAVYKARQPGLDRFVAIKILPPEVGETPAFAERFTREARALAKLNHPNVIGVYDFGQANGLFYFVMEYVDGVNLRQALQASRMPPKEALAIVPQICDALQFAHDEGVVHRDIKPENILIDKKGRVKIADFGLAKLLGQASTDVQLTATQQVMGTLRYMAPEQMEGLKEVDHRVDIYSLGVVFYEMLTGEVPMGRFAPPSQKVAIDVRIDEVVLRALEREPAQRYQHVSEVKTGVEEAGRPSIASVSSKATAQDSVFPIRYLPRDLTDILLSPIVTIWVGVVFYLLPCFVIYLLCTITNLRNDQSTIMSALGGSFVMLGCFSILATGSVQSVRVDRDGLTFNRYLGPSKFLPWSSIRRIEPLSRWEVIRHVWMWPGLPPRGSIMCCSARDWYRFDGQNDCWYFSPRHVEAFLAAIDRGQYPNAESIAVPKPLRPSEHRNWLGLTGVCAGELFICLLGLIPAAIPVEMLERGLSGIGTKASSSGLPGVSIGQIKSNSAADLAGLQDGDTVLAVNGAKVRDNDDISRFWMDISVGSDVAFKIKRDNNEIEVHATRGPEAVAAKGYRGFQILPGMAIVALIALVIMTIRLPQFAPWRGTIMCIAGAFAFALTLWNPAEWIQTVQYISYGGPGQYLNEHRHRMAIMSSMAILFGLGLLDFRQTRRIDPPLKLDFSELTVAIVGGIGFSVSILGAIITLNGNVNTIYFNFAAIPLIIIAAFGATLLYFRHLSNPQSGWKAEVPEMTLFFLGAAAGGIPWGITGFISFGTAWYYWHGMAFSLIYLALGLLAVILNGRGRPAVWRAALTLLGGLGAFAVIVVFGQWPPVVGGSDWSIRVGNNALQPGYFVAAVLAVQTSLLGALQLRQTLQTLAVPKSLI